MDAPQSSALRPPDASRCAALTGPAQRPGGARLSGSLIDSRPAHSDRALTWILTAGSGPDARAAGGSADRRARHDPARDQARRVACPGSARGAPTRQRGTRYRPSFVRRDLGIGRWRAIDRLARPIGAEHAGADAARPDIDRDPCCTGHVTLAAISRRSRDRRRSACRSSLLGCAVVRNIVLARLRRARAAGSGTYRRILPAKRGFGRQREA
jgi:hypothetical protein